MAGKQVPFPLPTYATPLSPRQTRAPTGEYTTFYATSRTGDGTVYYMGSMVSMYYNHQAVGIYKYLSTAMIVYNAPTRQYSFDQDFLTPAKLPPETPMLRDINAIGFTQMILPTQ